MTIKEEVARLRCPHPRIAVDKDINIGAAFWCKCLVCGHEAWGYLVHQGDYQLVDGWTAKRQR